MVEIDGQVVDWLARPDIKALPAGREMHTRKEIGEAISALLRVSSR